MPMKIIEMAKPWIKPLVPRVIRERISRRHFFEARGWQNLHWGVFGSVSDALAYAAKFGARTRFDTDHEATLRRHLTLRPHDYPILYWLTRLLPAIGDGRFVDFGGSYGASYYGYRDRLPLPSGMLWTVHDLPEVVARGRAIAEERAAHALHFTDRIGTIDGAEILFTAGTLQYIETPLADIIGALNKPPRHILVNRLALTGGLPYVTLQNTGVSISPCRVDNVTAFTTGLTRLGYVQEDSWRCLENSTEVPFHPECTLDHFLGFYFWLQT